MIYINLGFPKTSSTNLQANFYPNIKNVNYIGRYIDKPNNEVFTKLIHYIEKREDFDQKKLAYLKQDFKQLCSSKINIMSYEGFVVPYKKNNKTNNIEIISQFEMLTNLDKFLKDLNLNYKYFFIVRDRVESTKSLFATLQERIERLWGSECLDFNYFISKFLNKDSEYEKIKFFFEVFSIKKIKQTLHDQDITFFEYNEIKENPKKFLKKFSSYLKIEIDENLINNIKIKTRISPTIDNTYIIDQPKESFKVLKKLVPSFLKKMIIDLKIFKIIKLLFIRKIKVELSQGDEKLKKIFYEVDNEEKRQIN